MTLELKSLAFTASHRCLIKSEHMKACQNLLSEQTLL